MSELGLIHHIKCMNILLTVGIQSKWKAISTVSKKQRQQPITSDCNLIQSKEPLALQFSSMHFPRDKYSNETQTVKRLICLWDDCVVVQFGKMLVVLCYFMFCKNKQHCWCISITRHCHAVICGHLSWGDTFLSPNVKNDHLTLKYGKIEYTLKCIKGMKKIAHVLLSKETKKKSSLRLHMQILL